MILVKTDIKRVFRLNQHLVAYQQIDLYQNYTCKLKVIRIVTSISPLPLWSVSPSAHVINIWYVISITTRKHPSLVLNGLIDFHERTQ